MVYVSWPPGVAGSMESVLVIAKSIWRVTVVDDVAELLPVFVSVWLPVTVAVLAIGPTVAESTETTTVIVAVPPLARLPNAPVIVPDALVAVPWLAVADTNVTPDGNTSVTVTPVASLGPALVTVKVYVKVPADVTGSGESVLVICKSVC